MCVLEPNQHGKWDAAIHRPRLDAASLATREEYPGVDYVVVDDFTLCEYRVDGTGVMWSDSYIKVLTEKGRRSFSEATYTCSLPYVQIAVMLLERLRPDGGIVQVDVGRQSRMGDNASQTSRNIYNRDSKVLRIGLPGVETGDVVHIVTRSHALKPVMPDAWDDYQMLETWVPIRHAVYEIHAPIERVLSHVALRNPVDGTVNYRTYRDGRQVIYRWETSNVPAACREPGMPRPYTCLQRVLASTLPDWRAVSRWYWGLCHPHLHAATPAITHAVKSLVAGMTDRSQIVETLSNWVSRHVWPLDITEGESPGWEPRDVRLTFETRRGVCRDTAALLVSMLWAAGIEAYPVLVDTGPRKDPEVPTTRFNHVVVGIPDHDGAYQLLDCMRENSRQGCPASLRGHSYLVAHPAGESLRTSPLSAAEKNMVHIQNCVVVNAQGHLSGTAQIAYEGIDESLSRDVFAYMKPEDYAQHVEGIVKTAIPPIELEEFCVRPAAMRDTSERLSVVLKYRIDCFLPFDQDLMVVPVPFLGTAIGLANSLFADACLERRRFPLCLLSACGICEQVVLHMDSTFGSWVSLPRCEPVEDDMISWRCAFDHHMDTLGGRREFVIKANEISVGLYPQLLDRLKKIEYERRRMPIFARSFRSAL
jgi:hypothetical protein